MLILIIGAHISLRYIP